MKLIRQLFLIAWSILLFICEEEIDLTCHFVIVEGKHYASPRLAETLQTNCIVFAATFDESCQYTFSENSFQDSKNKLFGFADCNSMHHENSTRFAWQWLHNRREIFAYCYVNGERVEQFISVVEREEENQYTIELEDDTNVFSLNNDEPVRIKRGTTCDSGMYYTLWPYFGATLPAPHDVHLSIRMIY